MADNITLNPSAGGPAVATDDVGGYHHQRCKVEFGGDGTATEVKTATPLPVSQSSTGSVKNMFVRYLDVVGDGSGSKDAIGDYSSTAEVFQFAPAAGQVARVSRLMLQVEDVGQFDSSKYGNGITLSNGITMASMDSTGTPLIDLTDGLPIITNADWGRLCYDVTVLTFGIGNEHLLARFTFSKSGQYVRLDGDAGEYFGITLNDDFTGLVHHNFCLQGFWE